MDNQLDKQLMVGYIIYCAGWFMVAVALDIRRYYHLFIYKRRMKRKWRKWLKEKNYRPACVMPFRL